VNISTGVLLRDRSAWAAAPAPLRPTAWTSRLFDLCLGLGLALISLPGVLIGREGPRVVVLVFSLALSLPLIWRRRAPIVVFALIAAVAFVQWTQGIILFPDIALLIAFYTVAARESRRWTFVTAAALEFGVLLATIRWSTRHSALLEFVLLSGMATAAGVIGNNTRVRRAYLAEVEERAARLELERDQQAQLASAAERARIAREMHDIVAHNLSVLIALADGASLTVAANPTRAAQAMAEVSATGRTALAEMRRVLGVLREDERPAALRPAPSLANLDGLIAQMRRTGLTTSLVTEGRPRELEAGLELSIYRLVQEALTNTLKHATDAHEASVFVRFGASSVDVEVIDDGVVASTVTLADGAGHGIAGMRERAAAYGGAIEAGTLVNGGWRVRAHFEHTAPELAR
jgi:signal transduction histidine kinase